MTKKLRIQYAVYIFCAFLAVIFFVANIVVTQEQFLYNTVCSVLGTERRVLVEGDPSLYRYYEADYPDKASTLAAANALNERIVEEGIILLKNDGGFLPVATPASDSAVSERPRVTILGHNSVDLVYGGSGSGGASSKGAATIYDSLSAAGYDCNPEPKKFYESRAAGDKRDEPAMGNSLLAGIFTGETPISSYTDAVRSSFAAYSDFAIVVLSRLGGEGFDLPRTSKTSLNSSGKTIAGARSADDHYLQLDKNETDMIRLALDNFDSVVVLVNSSEAMELGFLDDPTHYLYTDGGYADSVKATACMNKLKAAVWIGSPGRTGINALGRVLNGSVNPSGRTVDTFARDFTADPTYYNFGTNNVMHGNEYYTVRSNGKLQAREQYLVEYEEGIYVGYRYYETRYVTEGAGGDAWYGKNVVFPLGYGMSYTNFEWELTNKAELEAAAIEHKSELTVKVRVKNVGDRAGKDVVQVYVNAPYYDGEIEKSEVVLVGFGKTPLLAAKGEGTEETPEECVLEIPVKAEYFASYDYNDANGNDHKGYEIEHGNYELRVSRNAHEAVATATVSVPSDILITTDAKTGKPVGNLFDDVSEHIEQYLSRTDWEGTWCAPPTEAERTVTQGFLDSLGYDGVDAGKPWEASEPPTQSRYELKYKDTVKLYELIGVDYEDTERWDALLDQLTVEQMAEMIGTGNYNTMAIDNIGKPRTIDPDGPVGFTAFMGDPSVYDTCFYASGCVLGATYNRELAFDMGEMVGNEGILGNLAGDGTPYSGWYAPAVNIHRSPFGGRNWEYYSEDGYLTGSMAAQVILGAKSKGIYCYVKHFALNEQETHRSTGILTFASEQAMREIYLRAFELCVKEGETTALMSSFNRIGTVWAGGSYELMTTVLREEWGFCGMVITDYNYATPYMNVNQMIRAGGDLNLTQKGWPSTDGGATQVSMLRRATKNILYTVVNSAAMNGYGPGVIYKYIMPVWVVWLIVADVIILVGMGVWTFFFVRGIIRRKKSKQAEAAENTDSDTDASDDNIVLSDGNVIKNINIEEDDV